MTLSYHHNHKRWLCELSSLSNIIFDFFMRADHKKMT